MSRRADKIVAWTSDERDGFLSQIAMFRALDADARQAVSTRCRVRRVGRGELIFVEGQPADSVNILAEGQVKVVRETDDGREVILRLIQPGELFGGAGGWGADVYPATTLAVDDATILVLPAKDFTELIMTIPAFAVAVIRELGDRLRLAEARIQELQTERVERRIARALLRLAGSAGQKSPEGIEILTPLSRQSLADLCGTTLSTASRILSAWDRAGILDAGRQRVVIKRAHELVAIAEDLTDQ